MKGMDCRLLYTCKNLDSRGVNVYHHHTCFIKILDIRTPYILDYPNILGIRSPYIPDNLNILGIRSPYIPDNLNILDIRSPYIPDKDKEQDLPTLGCC